MQRPQAASGQGESLVRLKLQPHFFASGLTGLAGTAELREEQPGSPAPRAPAPGPWVPAKASAARSWCHPPALTSQLPGQQAADPGPGMLPELPRGTGHPGGSQSPACSTGCFKAAHLRALDQQRIQQAVTDRSSRSCLSLLLQGASVQCRAAGSEEKTGYVCSRLGKESCGSSCVPQGAGLALQSSIYSCLGQGSSAKTPREGSYEQGLFPGTGCGTEWHCLLALG